VNGVQTPDHYWPRPPESQPDNLLRGRENLFAVRDQHDPALSRIAQESSSGT
jgi:hypothetical protein